MATRLSSILDSAFVDRISRRMCVSESKQKESVVDFQVSNCINIHVSKLHVIIKVVCSTSRKPTFHAGHYPWWWGLACVSVISYTCFSFSIQKWHSRVTGNQSKQVDGERYWKPVILANKFSPKLVRLNRTRWGYLPWGYMGKILPSLSWSPWTPCHAVCWGKSARNTIPCRVSLAHFPGESSDKNLWVGG